MRSMLAWMAILAIVAAGAVSSADAAYVGKDVCGACHANVLTDFVDSGHPYKINKVDGAPPTYPFSEVPNPPEGYTWDDITYVIGGYGWKARFMDANGYIITGATVQYNLTVDTWSGYHADEAPGTKPYTCGACHTTGWQTLDENGGVHQDGLEGISGTWAEPGVSCEACHGEGSEHVSNAGDKTKIVVDSSAELCSTCHFRDKEHRIAASGGFIRHHEQYDSMIGSKHRNQECITCHDPHKSTRYAQGGSKDSGTCVNCHTDQQQMIEEMAHLECKECHMPYATKSATATGEGVYKKGDVRTHIFKVNPDPNANMFYEDDGKFYVDSDAEGDAFVTLDFVCLSCHNGTDASKQDMAWAAATFKGVHEVATPVAEVATAETPTTYELSQNSPNPFNPETWLTYELPSQTRVVMTVYSLSGQKVRTLVDEDHTQGRYSVSWDGKDDFGGAVASGVYLCRMDAGTFASVRKMTLLR